MNDYSKIGERANPAAESRSIDFSDLSFSPPQTPKYPRYSAAGCKDAAPRDRPADEPPFPEEDGTAGERFGVILSRNCSSASRRFRAPDQRGNASSAALQDAVRRAFSMRKSSSATEGYRRIHDTGEDDGDGDCDGNAMSRLYQPQEARAPRKKRGKILRACKRIFGF